MQGTISFGAGFFFVVIGWPVIGMILEAYGSIILFRSVKILKYWFIVICSLCMVEDANGNFVQWLLANTGYFPSEDTYSWLGLSTTIY